MVEQGKPGSKKTLGESEKMTKKELETLLEEIDLDTWTEIGETNGWL